MIAVREDPYFETLLEKDDKVPPIRKEKPKKNKTNVNNTTISAIHLGTFFFSSQEMGF